MSSHPDEGQIMAHYSHDQVGTNIPLQTSQMSRREFSFNARSPLISLFCLGAFMLNGCTSANPIFKTCYGEEEGCIEPEECNGEDDDQDGVTDEDQAEPCVTQETLVLSGDGPEGNFGRSMVAVGDRNGDGVEELLVSATRSAEEIIGRPPREGAVYLLDGLTGEVLWSVTEGGDYGYRLAIGDFNGNGALNWVASAPSQETDIGVGRLYFNTFDRDVLREQNSSTDGGFGYWLSTSPREGIDWLLTSEPEREEMGTVNAGRILGFTLTEEGDRVVQVDFRGDEEGQRFGERVISVMDSTDDGIPELLTTAWKKNQEDVLERQVWLLEGATGRRLKRFYASEDTDGSLGSSMAWGSLGASGELQMAFGSPRVRRDDQSFGRIYFINQDGEDRGTSTLGGDDLEYGTDMITFPLSGAFEGQEGLVIAARGRVRILGSNHEVVQEINFGSEEIPTLARSTTRDPSGRYRVWVGLPEDQLIYILSVR